MPGDDATPSERTWAKESESPRWLPEGPLVLGGCAGYERGLTEVAGVVAERQAAGVAPLEMAEIGIELRASGSPHVWPRVWTIEAPQLSSAVIEQAFQTWLDQLPTGAARRCGIARRKNSAGIDVVAALVVEPLADLASFPTSARIGQWLRFSASPGESALGAKVILLGPRGVPRPVPTRFSRDAVRASFNLDASGLWRVQLLLETATGPRPALEAWVFVDATPTRAVARVAAPGELDAGAGSGLLEWRRIVLEMINTVRASEQLPPLERDERLDELAQIHADAVRRSGQAAHDTGDGSPLERVTRLGYAAHRVGENVAQARGLARAHRALWNSPAHRSNLLDSGFDRVGVGVSVDTEPARAAHDTLLRVWVCGNLR